MADTNVIILVSDPDDPKHGEITVADDADKAERLIESLLEAGYEQNRVRVFTGSENQMRVSHRPVVSIGDDADRDSQSGVAGGDATDAGEPDEPREDGEEEDAEGNGANPKLSGLFRKS
jgi:hypothetical protein